MSMKIGLILTRFNRSWILIRLYRKDKYDSDNMIQFLTQTKPLLAEKSLVVQTKEKDVYKVLN